MTYCWMNKFKQLYAMKTQNNFFNKNSSASFPHLWSLEIDKVLIEGHTTTLDYCKRPRLNIKTVLSTYGDFHVKDKTAVRTSYL